MPASRMRQRSIYSISEYGNITSLMSRVTLRGETSTHLESVILPWVKPAYPLVVSSPSLAILHLPSFPFRRRFSLSRRGYIPYMYLVIFALSTANKFTFANGKCHFIVRHGNNLSKFSPKHINKTSNSSAGPGQLLALPMPAGFRRSSRIRRETLIFGKTGRGCSIDDGLVSGTREILKVHTFRNVK